MAYASSTVAEAGGTSFQINETDTQTTSEVTLTGVPAKGRIIRIICEVVLGSQTVDPILGVVADPSDIDIILENGTPATSVDNVMTTGIPYYTPSNTLYHRSRPSSNGASVNTRYLIKAGW